jgi:hypothetical protein
VGQDYLSPQATNFFLYLCAVAVLLTFFRRVRAPQAADGQQAGRGRAWLTAWLTSWIGELPPPTPTTVGQRLGLTGLLVAITGASIISHQLTPVILVIALGVLAVFRRTNLRGLTFLSGFALLAFISYGTVPFWSTHLHDMFGGVGHVGSSVGKNLGDRVRGDSSHQLVLQIRLILTLLIWLVAAVGVLRRLRRRGVEPALLLLAGAPVVILGMQSYGGEALLRVQLFTLPFMVMLLVVGFAPQPWRVRRVAVGAVVLGALSAFLAVGFYVARFGNESFEFMRADEVEAMNWVYDNAPVGSSLAIYNQTLPWEFRNVGDHRHLLLDHQFSQETRDLHAATTFLRQTKAGGFVIFTTGQDASGEQNHGYPKGWIWDLGEQMLKSGDYRLVYSNPDAWVLEVLPTRGAPQVGGPEPVPPAPKRQPYQPPVVPSAPPVDPAPPLQPATPADQLAPGAPIAPVDPTPTSTTAQA